MSQEVDFFQRRARSLTTLRGFPVRRDGKELGVLEDFTFDVGGDLASLVVHAGTGARELPVGPGLVLGPDALRPAV